MCEFWCNFCEVNLKLCILKKKIKCYIAIAWFFCNQKSLWQMGWMQVEQGFSSFFAKILLFLMIFLSRVQYAPKAKNLTKMKKSLVQQQPITQETTSKTQKTTFENLDHHYYCHRMRVLTEHSAAAYVITIHQHLIVSC